MRTTKISISLITLLIAISFQVNAQDKTAHCKAVSCRSMP